MSYRAVIFDLYDTLLYAMDTGTRAAAIEVAKAAGASEAAWKEGWRVTSDRACRGQFPSLCERAAVVLQMAGVASPDQGLVDGLAGLLHTRQYPVLFPDTRPALAEVRARGYRLGMISNLPLDEGAWLKVFDLEAAFDAVVMSYDVGLVKPKPEIYARAAERLGVAAEECLFVDDVPQYLEGARAVGMTPVRISRPGLGAGRLPDARETPRVGSLEEFVEWLGD